MKAYIITQLAVYTTYILPIGWLYATYHLLREPGTSIEVLDTILDKNKFPRCELIFDDIFEKQILY